MSRRLESGVHGRSHSPEPYRKLTREATQGEKSPVVTTDSRIRNSRIEWPKRGTIPRHCTLRHPTQKGGDS